MKLIYKPWGSNSIDNPRGFPSAYPRDSMRIADDESALEGWLEITEQDYNALIQAHYATVAAINASIAAVPDEVMLWQFRAAVTLAGKKEAVDSAIALLPEPAKTVASQKWEYGNTVRRNHPLTIQLGAAVGLTPNQIDDVFIMAASL